MYCSSFKVQDQDQIIPTSIRLETIIKTRRQQQWL